MATYKNELSATLFVRNLPHDAEQSKFQDIFSNIGPIKKTHLVRTQDNMCKGYGYVTFAVRQDAEKAINETINYEKNRLSVKFSHSKNDSDDTRQIRSEPTAKRLKYERKFVQKQGRLIIRNLSFKCNEKTLRKEFEKYGNLDEISIAKKAGN
ncbi:RBM28 (predicted) [Pycnogonum litorale]